MHKIDVGLAKWILMCHDRMDGEEIALTHKNVASMLGVGRSSVTAALHIREASTSSILTGGLVRPQSHVPEAFAADAYDVPGVSGCSWPTSAIPHWLPSRSS